MKIKLGDTIVIIVSVISLIVFLLNLSYFYDSFILRGYTEASMWVGEVEKGKYAREYYHLLNYIIQNTNLNLSQSVNLLTTISLLYCIYKFKPLKKWKNFIYFFTVFNLLSLLLMYSPGRTSLTIFGLILCYSNIFPKINPCRLLLGLIFVTFIHSASLIIILLLYSYTTYISIINKKIKDLFFNTLAKFISYIFIIFLFIIILYLDNDYINISDGSSNLINTILILGLIFSVLIFINLDSFMLLFLVCLVYLFIFNINAAYTYRVMIFPLLLGVYYQKAIISDSRRKF